MTSTGPPPRRQHPHRGRPRPRHRPSPSTSRRPAGHRTVPETTTARRSDLVWGGCSGLLGHLKLFFQFHCSRAVVRTMGSTTVTPFFPRVFGFHVPSCPSWPEGAGPRTPETANRRTASLLTCSINVARRLGDLDSSPPCLLRQSGCGVRRQSEQGEREPTPEEAERRL